MTARIDGAAELRNSTRIEAWRNSTIAAHEQLKRQEKRGRQARGVPKADDGPWSWPIRLDQYDRAPALQTSELEILDRYADAYRSDRHRKTMDFGDALRRLISPLNDALNYTGIRTDFRKYVLFFLLREMAGRKTSFWAWSADEWIETIERQKTIEYQHVIAIAYLLCDFKDLHRLSKNHIVYSVLARKIFGNNYMKVVGDRVQLALQQWGYVRRGTTGPVLRTVHEALLYKRSPHLGTLTIEDLESVVARHPARNGNFRVVALSRVLASIGSVRQPLEITRPVRDKKCSPTLTADVPAEWCRFSRLWYDQSTYEVRLRNKSYTSY